MDNIFLKDYKGQPLDLSKVEDSIIRAIININNELMKHGAYIVIHCMYDESGHVANSQHYLGKACDFHIVGFKSYSEALQVITEILIDLKLEEFVGFGIYPQWINKGFHLDTRGTKSRWSYLNGKYDTYKNGVMYVVKNKI